MEEGRVYNYWQKLLSMSVLCPKQGRGFNDCCFNIKHLEVIE